MPSAVHWPGFSCASIRGACTVVCCYLLELLCCETCPASHSRVSRMVSNSIWDSGRGSTLSRHCGKIEASGLQH